MGDMDYGLKSSITWNAGTAAVVMAPLRAMVRLFCDRHNQIQFFGYEVANIALVVHEAKCVGVCVGGVSVLWAALAFLCGSACIYAFEPRRRPSMLLLGGLALTLGGLLLARAGYPITGLAVTVASLETSRGGLALLAAFDREHGAEVLLVRTHLVFQLGTLLMAPYSWLIRQLSFLLPGLGRFIDRRPFVVGGVIKFPLRLEFVTKRLLAGDIFGALVGVSWMLLGDGGLALNDPALNAQLRHLV